MQQTTQLPDEPYYYRDAQPAERPFGSTPITACIAPALAAVERSPLTQIAAGLLLAFGCFLVGWYARGLWGPLVDNRGWAALVVFSITGSVFMVNNSNRRG